MSLGCLGDRPLAESGCPLQRSLMFQAPGWRFFWECLRDHSNPQMLSPFSVVFFFPSGVLFVLSWFIALSSLPDCILSCLRSSSAPITVSSPNLVLWAWEVLSETRVAWSVCGLRGACGAVFPGPVPAGRAAGRDLSSQDLLLAPHLDAAPQSEGNPWVAEGKRGHLPHYPATHTHPRGRREGEAGSSASSKHAESLPVKMPFYCLSRQAECGLLRYPQFDCFFWWVALARPQGSHLIHTAFPRASCLAPQNQGRWDSAQASCGDRRLLCGSQDPTGTQTDVNSSMSVWESWGKSSSPCSPTDFRLNQSRLELSELMECWKFRVLHQRRPFSASLHPVANTGMSLRTIKSTELTCVMAWKEHVCAFPLSLVPKFPEEPIIVGIV